LVTQIFIGPFLIINILCNVEQRKYNLFGADFLKNASKFVNVSKIHMASMIERDFASFDLEGHENTNQGSLNYRLVELSFVGPFENIMIAPEEIK
jgi:hypothetical protein